MTHADDNGKRDTRTDGRYRLRAWLWDAPRPSDAGSLRLTSCGRRRVAGYVSVRAGGGTAALGGLSTCGSVWVCPVCSPKVAARRSLEVTDAVRAWQARGGSVLLMTLTLSHGPKHSLAETWDAIGSGWASVRNGKPWKADAAAFGIAGYLRVVEVTHSRRNGWHPHAHVLLFVTGTPTDADCEQLRARVFGRWSRRLGKDGFRTLDFDRTGKAVGVDVRRADAHTLDYLAEYLSKFGYQPRSSATALALEATRGDLKSGRAGSRTPWELAELARDGDSRAWRLWLEWERGSLGRRQYSWSQGFRESLDLESVLTDQEAVEREEAAASDTVALLAAEAWARLVADLRANSQRPGVALVPRMLSAAAVLDPDRFRDWLTDHGIEHVDPATDTPASPPIPVEVADVSTPAPRPNLRDRARRDRLRHERQGLAAADARAEGSHYAGSL